MGTGYFSFTLGGGCPLGEEGDGDLGVMGVGYFSFFLGGRGFSWGGDVEVLWKSCSLLDLGDLDRLNCLFLGSPGPDLLLLCSPAYLCCRCSRC